MTFTFLILLQALTSSIPSLADNPQHQLNLDMNLDAAFFKAADKNGDGALNLAEYEGEMDRRLDAAISKNPAAQQKFGGPERQKIRDGMLAPSFRSFDRNSDGLLTTSELEAARKTMGPNTN